MEGKRMLEEQEGKTFSQLLVQIIDKRNKTFLKIDDSSDLNV
jgi:hypothetical protein